GSGNQAAVYPLRRVLAQSEQDSEALEILWRRFNVTIVGHEHAIEQTQEAHEHHLSVFRWLRKRKHSQTILWLLSVFQDGRYGCRLSIEEKVRLDKAPCRWLLQRLHHNHNGN